MSEEHSLYLQIITRAMKDEAFRQQLLSNPRKAIESEPGVSLPANLMIQVHEDTPTTIHLVLPMRPSPGEAQELSDAELTTIVGGAGPVASHGLFTLPGGQHTDAPCEFKQGAI